MQKYGFDDARDVLERASARETAARVAAGTPGQGAAGADRDRVLSHVVRLGPVRAEPGSVPALERPRPRSTSPQVRCFDPEAEARMVDAIKAAAKEGDSLGGVAEVIAYGVPVGSAATCTGTAGSTPCWPRRS